MRADRLLSLALLLQARGAATARALAAELGVSVRTVYRDLEALSAAGVPVVTEPGPGGGCRLMDGYRFPLRGLRPDEAEALLILGVPAVLRDLGLAGALTAAHRQIRVTAGLTAAAPVHLDMPRWFGGQEEVPCLRDLARALRLGRKLAIRYPPADREPRVVGPLGLVNKAGTWYLVAEGGGTPGVPGRARVRRPGAAGALRAAGGLRAGRVLGPLVGGVRGEQATAPGQAGRLAGALDAFSEVFGPAAGPALEAAGPPGQDGWRVVTLSFEHERAAVHRLAGFGDQVEVLDPPSVRAELLATAREILGRYQSGGLGPVTGLHAVTSLTALWYHARRDLAGVQPMAGGKAGGRWPRRRRPGRRRTRPGPGRGSRRRPGASSAQRGDPGQPRPGDGRATRPA